MFVGHGLLAFAIAAGVAHALGGSRERAISIGLIAGAFGLVPDVDILYAPAGLLASLDPEAFWAAGNLVHRTVTHSLPVGVVAAVAVWLVVGATTTRGGGGERSTWPPLAPDWIAGTRLAPGWIARARFVAAGTLLAGLVILAATVSGVLAAMVTTAFAVALGLVALAAVNLEVTPPVAGGTALVGLLSHPFGDLFTGRPPTMLYPFDATLVAERVLLHSDPTLHLLGAMGVELATAWLALLVYLRISGHRPREFLAGRAGLGAGYAALAPVLAPPTLAVSYQFVFSVLAVGLIVGLASGNLPALAPGGRFARTGRRLPDRFAFGSDPPDSGPDLCRIAVTGLSAISLATIAYAGAYLLV